MNARNDASLARAMGILSGEAFARPSFGNEGPMGVDTYQYYGYGSPHGADPLVGFGGHKKHKKHKHKHHGHPAQNPQVAAILAKHAREEQATAARESLLHPNKGSKIDIERYDFTIGTQTTIGAAGAGAVSASKQPSVTVRPQRCSFNAPSYGFMLISAVQLANVNAIIGQQIDAATYNAQAFGTYLDLPTLSPANTLSFNGTNTGFVPPGFNNAQSYWFAASFQCPATVVA